jgi:thiopeptide-type bacteriocin biosynthesis protein
MEEYNFSDKLILRTPFYGLDKYSIIETDEVILNPFFQNALYLASPALHRLLADKQFLWAQFTAKEKLTINRYYNRFCFRPTPFGSFASFTVTKWGSDELLRLEERAKAKLHVNIDQEYLLRLAEQMSVSGIWKENFNCNPTLYKWGKDFRFIKTSFSEDYKKTFFDLESIENNTLTSGLLSFCIRRHRNIQEIITHIIGLTNCDLKTATDYLYFLITAKILVPQNGINIIGEDYAERLAKVPELSIHSFHNNFARIVNQLDNIGYPGVKDLADAAEQLNVLLDEKNKNQVNQFFYTGLERKSLSGSISTNYQSDILNGLKALAALATPQQPPMLQQFIQDFKIKYDKQKIPLLQAIDPDIGIGYGPIFSAAGNTELLRDVMFHQKQDSKITIEWSPTHRLLLSKWNTNLNYTDPIELNDSDIQELSPVETFTNPPSLSVIFRIIEDGIYLESAGGASATALIGRFTAWNDDILNLSRSMANKEQSANPNVVFADIGQLSDPHVDNINRRKHSYDFEIPVNLVSTLPSENQVALADLWVSVMGNNLVLEARSLGKVIIPRLTSAYNYGRSKLAVFRILCDLQYQGIQGNYTFNLDQFFPGMPYYPRVTYKRTILSPAIWYLSGKAVRDLDKVPADQGIAKFKAIRQDLKLPPMVALSNFDQQLVFDLENDNDILFLLDCLKGSDRVMLQEFFNPGTVVCSNEDDRPMVNQFVACLYKNKETYSGIRTDDPRSGRNIKSDYILGSSWLYLKIYCNPAMSNDILSKKLLPLINQFGNFPMQSWFFIRYRDSDYHIRLRIKLNESAIGPVLKKIKAKLHDSISYHLIRDYQADTYRREMERYGPDIIEKVEDFFYASSDLVLRYIKISGTKSFNYSYHSLAFVSVAQLIQSFIPDKNDQISFLEEMVDMFYSEFSKDKSLKIDLDQKYRDLKLEVNMLLSRPDYYAALKLTPSASLFTAHLTVLLLKSSAFNVKRKNQLLADIIHMHLNRLFVDRQRNQELIVYYVLYKYQLSARARNKGNS